MIAAQPGKQVSIPAASDLSATPYRFVTSVTTGTIALAAAGAAVDGVLANKPDAAGQPALVTLDGIEWVEVGGSVTIGDIVKSDSVGRAVTATAANVLAGLGKGRALATASSGYVPVLLTPGPNAAAQTGVETLTGAGTIDSGTEITEWIATTDNATLEDGLYVGQRKIVRAAVGTTGSNIITPTTVSAFAVGGTQPATMTITTPGQEIEYEWRSDGWAVMRIQQAGTVDLAGGGTVNPLVADYREAISGTEVLTLPAGIYPGQEFYVEVISAVSTPVLDVAGSFYDEDASADGTNVTFDAADVGDRMLCRWNGARWSIRSHTGAAVEV